MLFALAGCGHGMWQYGERAEWRHEAEASCMKSGAVKLGVEVVQEKPIEGPGICGMDFPLKVTELDESNGPMAYADDLRPPAAIPRGAGPRWPVRQPAYAPPAAIPNGEHMQWITGPQGVPQTPQPDAGPNGAGAPMSIAPPGESAPAATLPRASRPETRLPDDIPDDAILPPETQAPRRIQRASYPPEPQTPARPIPPLGPNRIPAATPVALNPPATLACPIVSALDRWVSGGVQPAALHWFGVPVKEIRQISAYSCREMVGAGGHGISEHAFGNAIDIAGFTLADGRSISVVKGWHGSAEEQGFLHDVQLYACETFTTVLAPGYNAAHYNHIHVDLMHRRPGYRPCRPTAVPGEVVAARVRAHYASKGAPAYTGSITTIGAMIAAAKAGEDGLDDEPDDAPALPPAKKTALFDFSGFNLFGKSSLEDTARAKAAH